MPQLQLVIGGRWAPAIGPWGDLQWSTCLQGGDECSWVMDRHYRRIQARQSVRIYDGPTPIWYGLLTRRGAGDTTYRAEGAWKEAYYFRAIDTGGFPTPIPDDAIDGAISRGLPCTRGMSFNTGTPTAMSADLQGEVPSLGDLLDTWADRHNRYWMVNGAGELVWYLKPTTPDVVVVPDQPMNAADDDYSTTLWAVRKSSGGVKTMSGPVTDADAAASTWGTREDLIDLTDFGNMTDPVALAVLDGILKKRRARLGWTGPLTTTPDRLTNGYGIPAYTPRIQAGQLARALVQWEDTRDLNGRLYRDFLIARTQHTSADPAVTIEPVGLVARDLASVIARFKHQHRRERGRPRAERV